MFWHAFEFPSFRVSGCLVLDQTLGQQTRFMKPVKMCCQSLTRLQAAFWRACYACSLVRRFKTVLSVCVVSTL